MSRHTRASIVNAGDGAHEHPTQALLDAFVMRREKKRIDGLVVAICGDILHSRVARSNALLQPGRSGPRCACAEAAHADAPVGRRRLGPTVRAMGRIDDAVTGADVVMMLRIQTERLAGAMLASTREYARTVGRNARVLAQAKPDAIVMHPGPINRGVEIDPRIADGERSVILDQVEAGVAVRMAVLDAVVKAGDAQRDSLLSRGPTSRFRASRDSA